MKYIKVSEYAKLMGGQHRRTIIRHFHEGIIPGKQLETGTILLEDPRIKSNDQKKVVIYASTQLQLISLQKYAEEKGYLTVKHIQETTTKKYLKLEKILEKNDTYDILLMPKELVLTYEGINYINIIFKTMGKYLEYI